MKQQFKLVHLEARRRAVEAVKSAPDGWVVEVKEATRTLDQNALLWATLTDVAEQVEWYGKFLTPDDWKHIFTAALKRTQVVPGLDGGFVVLGQHTSNMTKRDFSDLCEIIFAFGAEHDVKWSDERKAA